MVNGNVFGKGPYFLDRESCINPVTCAKVFYVIPDLFHYTGTFVTQCKRHLVILYKSYTPRQLKNFQRIDSRGHNLYKDFIFMGFRNRNFIYRNLDLF